MRIHKHISKGTPVRTGEYAPVESRPESHRIPKGQGLDQNNNQLEKNMNHEQGETKDMTNEKLKPEKKIRMERSVLTSMEPVVIEMAKLRASQKEQGWGHSEHVDEGQQDEV